MAVMLPDADYKRLATIFNAVGISKSYLGVLVENGFEFAGASEDEGTFIASDGLRIIITSQCWRIVPPAAEAIEGIPFNLLSEFVNSYLHKV